MITLNPQSLFWRTWHRANLPTPNSLCQLVWVWIGTFAAVAALGLILWGAGYILIAACGGDPAAIRVVVSVAVACVATWLLLWSLKSRRQKRLAIARAWMLEQGDLFMPYQIESEFLALYYYAEAHPRKIQRSSLMESIDNAYWFMHDVVNALLQKACVPVQWMTPDELRSDNNIRDQAGA